MDVVTAEERVLRGLIDAAVVAEGDGGNFAVADFAQLERELVDLVVGDEVQHVTGLAFFHADFFREVEERRGDAEGGELRRGGLVFGDLRGAVVTAGGEGEFAELFEVHLIAEGHIDAFGLGVDGVGEVATATDRGQTLRGEEVGHRRARVITGKDDAVLDVGAVEINRGGEVGEGLGGEADALAGGFLGLKIRSAEGLGEGQGDREGAHFEEHAADVVGRRGAEPLLRQVRGAEAGAHRATERERFGNGQTGGELAGAVGAEIAVLLKATGRRDEPLLGDVLLEIDVGRFGVAGVGAGIGGFETTEDLRADRSEGASIWAVDDADAAVAVRIGLAGADFVLFPAQLGAEGDLERGFEANFKLVGEFEVGRPLVKREFTVVEAGLAGGAEGGVFGLSGHVVEDVAAVNGAEVPGPTAGFAFEAGADGVIGDLGLNDREETVRINGADGVVLAGTTEEAGAFGVFDAAAAEEVEFEAVIEGEFAVEPDALVFGARVAEAVVVAVDGGFAGIERAAGGAEAGAGAVVAGDGGLGAGRGVGAEILLARIGFDAAGRAVVADVRGEEERAAFAQFGAGVGVDFQIATVAALGGAVSDGGTPADVFTEDDVDDASDGVGAVLRGGAVTEHFDAADGGGRDGVEIRGDGAAADGAVEVDERAGVAAFAVDQHEGLVGGETTQRGGTDVVRAVGERGTREIKRRDERLDGLGRLGVAALVDVVAGDDVDRHGRLGDGAVIETRASRNEGFEFDDFFAGGFGGGRRLTDQGRRNAGQKRGDGQSGQ